MGAEATNHGARNGVRMACAGELSQAEAETIFQRAMQGQAGEEDAARFARLVLLAAIWERVYSSSYFYSDTGSPSIS